MDFILVICYILKVFDEQRVQRHYGMNGINPNSEYGACRL